MSNRPDYDPVRRWGCTLFLAVYLAAFVFAVIALCSCSQTKYIPVETVRTEHREADTSAIYNRLLNWFESLRQKETASDSVIDRQKETLVLKENGDTARHDKERIIYVSSRHEKELEHEVRQKDSIIESLQSQLKVVTSDTIRVPYPVERPLSRWEQAKMDLGGVAIGVLSAIIIAAVLWLARKFRK